MKTKIIIGDMIAVLLILSMVSATSIDINVRPVFKTGESISFDYTISSEKSQNIEYTVYVTCPIAPQSMLEIKNAVLNPSIPLIETYVYISNLEESIESQECKAVVWIEKPEKMAKEEYFSIETNPASDLNILTCKDLDCNEQTKVFVKGDEVYINYNSSIEGLAVNTVLTYPDNSNKQFTLPNSFTAEQIGTYSLEISASKQDYETVIRHLNVGVVAEEANIGYTPTNEIEKEEKESNLNLTWIIFPVIMSLILIGIITYFIIRKKKSVR